jgi:hypothetical protein
MFPFGIPVNPVVDHPVIRRVEGPESLRRTERGVLRAEIITANVDHIDQIARRLMYFFQIHKGCLCLLFKYLMDVILVYGCGHIPFGNVPNTFGVLQHRAGNERDIAERGAASLPVI